MTEAPFYLQLASCQVFVKSPGSGIQYVGTGAVYRLPNVVVTAAHCVPPLEGAQYLVKVPTVDDAWVVERVVRHDESDIAVLIGRPDVKAPPRMYTGVDGSLIEGGDFIAFGYPAEGVGAVARYFKGHFQRYLGYRGPAGRTYFADELSIPAPAGLSGGPISYPHAPDKLVAVVTTNHDSYFVVDSFEEVERDGNVSRGEIRRVGSYGIAAMLSGKEAWLHEVVENAGG